VWVIHGTSDPVMDHSYGENLVDELLAGGFVVEFTPVDGADHNWLWQYGYGQDNQDLLDWFQAHGGP